MTRDPRVIVALDFESAAKALEFVERIDLSACRLKVGKQLFTSAGPHLVRQLVDRGGDVFLDLKFHDIPNTVAEACRAAADLGVWMLNVHALGGRRMLESARAAVDRHRVKLIGVTLLTSSGQTEMDETGLSGTPSELVSRLARLASEAGLDGVVCSAAEAPTLRREQSSEFLLVTPGIRPDNFSDDDQKRIVTPGQAVENGASYLVIGRPITQATDPAAVLQSVNRELNP